MRRTGGQDVPKSEVYISMPLFCANEILWMYCVDWDDDLFPNIHLRNIIHTLGCQCHIMSSSPAAVAHAQSLNPNAACAFFGRKPTILANNRQLETAKFPSWTSVLKCSKKKKKEHN